MKTAMQVTSTDKHPKLQDSNLKKFHMIALMYLFEMNGPKNEVSRESLGRIDSFSK